MKIVIVEQYLKQTSNIPKNYGTTIKTQHFYLKEKNYHQKNLLQPWKTKKKYVVYISALKQALNHTLKLRKIHRVIEFRQEAWLKPYIYMNAKLRMQAKNDFEKDFFKLMNDSVFGKTMENVRNH